MAKRRMISVDITTAHFFRRLPHGAQALYVQFVVSADDDGFISDAEGIRVSLKAKKSDLDALVEKRYVLKFESGIYVIKHWGLANRVDNRMYSPTLYREERAQLIQRVDGSWTDHIVPEDNMAKCSMRNDNQLWLDHLYTREKRVKNWCFDGDLLEQGSIEKISEFYRRGSRDDEDDITNTFINNNREVLSSWEEDCIKLFRLYGKTPNTYDFDQYRSYVNGDSEYKDMLEYAFEFAARAGKVCMWNYISGIWVNWMQRGLKTAELVMEAEAKRDMELNDYRRW